jgi:hypothetical protein
MMFKICGRTLNEQGKVADTAIARCIFQERNDAASYLNKLVQLLRPNAGYEGEQDYWWVRNSGVVTQYTIQS